MLGVFALHHTFFFSAQRPGVEFFLYVLCIGIHFLFSSCLFFSSYFHLAFASLFLQFSISSFFSLHFLLSSMLHSLDFLFSLSFILFNSLNSIA